MFYLINKESGEIQSTDSNKRKLRLIHKKMKDRELWKVSKFDKLVASFRSTQKKKKQTDKKKNDSELNLDKDDLDLSYTPKRKRFKGRLNRRIIKRKFKVKPETQQDMREAVRAGVGVKCKRRKDKKGNYHEIELQLERLSAK